VYGEEDPEFTYTASDPSVILTGKLGREPGENAGIYAITIGTLSAGEQYAINFVSADFTITKKAASVTPNAASKVYGEADPTFTGVLTGFLAGDNVVAVYSRQAGETVAGSPYEISATLSPAGVLGNYEITYNTANFTITKREASVTPNAASKVYGEADPTFTGVLTGFLAGDNVVAVYSRAAGETVAGSPYAISAVLSPEGVLANYNITYNTAEFTITKKEASVTPNDATKVYGEADPTFTGVLTGFLVADGVTAVYSREAGETVAGSPYVINAVLSPEEVLDNYDITYNTANFTITPKAITVTADPKTKTYGLPDPALTYGVTGMEDGDSLTGGLARVAGENVGTYQITIGTLTAGPNYTITFVPANLTITARPITITADDKERMIGDSDPVLTYSITAGSLAFDDEVTGALVRDAGEALGTYPIKQGTLAIDDGKGGANYDLTFVEGTFTIKQIPITITAHAATKVYGEEDPEFTYTASDPSVALTGALGREPGENVGAYAITIGTLSAGPEYAITFVSADLSITKRPITIAVDDKEKVEGDPDPVLTWKIKSGSLAFADKITGVLERESGEDVGVYKILIGSLKIDDGNNGENYNLKFEEGTFKILSGKFYIFIPLLRQ
ncbi:MAG TPA: MBG domain-containing protein, partial [Brevefilum fermentans]|nr:MBG domain-containing protein [Brevefilum fermentans]